MPISTPETEHMFKLYGSALEVKGAAKSSLVALESAVHLGRDMEPAVRQELESAIAQVRRLLDAATEAVTRLRPTKIEDRGYSAADRGFGGFKSCSCDDNCGGCGSGGGGCGGCKP